MPGHEFSVATVVMPELVLCKLPSRLDAVISELRAERQLPPDFSADYPDCLKAVEQDPDHPGLYVACDVSINNFMNWLKRCSRVPDALSKAGLQRDVSCRQVSKRSYNLQPGWFAV